MHAVFECVLICCILAGLSSIPVNTLTLQSYDVPAAVEDHGRARMEQIRSIKQNNWDSLVSCRQEGTCPERAARKSEGPLQCIDGQAGQNSCWNIEQRSFVSFDDLSGGEAVAANDVWGWVDPRNGDEYVIQCLNSGTSFVRITDPENPVVVGYLPTQTIDSYWRDAKVIGNFAYIVSESLGHGLQIFDLTLLRDISGFQILKPTVEWLEFGNAHNIVANEETGYVYVVGAVPTIQSIPGITCAGGLLMIDVNDPMNPTFAGCFLDDGYTHDAQCVIYRGPDQDYYGKEICFCYNEDTLNVVDVSNKSHPQLVAKKGYIGVAYTHQGWLTEDQTVILLDDEYDERTSEFQNTRTYIWDVSDLDNPELKNIYISSEVSADHNLYIRGNYTYQSNYMAGFRMLHIDQENYALSEVGYFDMMSGENNPTFDGAWSSYPYFPSGNLAVGSTEHGLFILKANMTAIESAATVVNDSDFK